MEDLAKLEEQSFVQKRGPWIIGIALVVVIGAYTIRFPVPFLADQAVWGQFGDFVGGLINPIVGFFTILLLSVSLRQNHKALAQANASLKQANDALQQSKQELELTREAIEQAASLQAATESALKEQIAIAEHARDLNNSTALWGALAQRKTEMDARFKGRSWQDNDPEFVRLQRGISEATIGMNKLERIMAAEIDRLDNKYSCTL